MVIHLGKEKKQERCSLCGFTKTLRKFELEFGEYTCRSLCARKSHII